MPTDSELFLEVGMLVLDKLLQESKNLTENPRLETAQREGTLKKAEAKGKIIEHAFWMQKKGYERRHPFWAEFFQVFTKLMY